MSKSIDINNLSKEELVLQVRDLQHQVALLQKLVFGPRSERFKLTAEVPKEQLSLGITTEAIAEVEVKKTTIKEHDRARVKLQTKKHPGRTPLPSSLRREEIIIEPQEDVSGLTRLEDEITEVLEVKAAEFYVKRYVRRKYGESKTKQIVHPTTKAIVHRSIDTNMLFKKADRFIDISGVSILLPFYCRPHTSYELLTSFNNANFCNGPVTTSHDNCIDILSWLKQTIEFSDDNRC